jgi:four helix bundle protein
MSAGAGGQGPGAEGKRDDPLMKFGAYGKALELFDGVADDMEGLTGQVHLLRLISQQIASADSIASNIEKGYGRGSRKDYLKFLVISRGSARETASRYGRFRKWLPQEIIQKREALCHEIIAILSASILSLRAAEKKDPPGKS